MDHIRAGVFSAGARCEMPSRAESRTMLSAAGAKRGRGQGQWTITEGVRPSRVSIKKSRLGVPHNLRHSSCRGRARE